MAHSLGRAAAPIDILKSVLARTKSGKHFRSCRSIRSRLDALATRLTDDTGRSVEVIAADLNDKADLARVEQVLRTDTSSTLLVINAGIAATAPLLDSDVDKMDEIIALSIRAPMRLAYAAAPGFVARGGGSIINIASIVAGRGEGR
jgi:short-subunit dehydrogenase